MTEKILPCPFCGGGPVRLKKTVQCQNCGAQGPYTSEDTYDDQCEHDWNNRVPASGKPRSKGRVA